MNSSDSLPSLIPARFLNYQISPRVFVSENEIHLPAFLWPFFEKQRSAPFTQADLAHALSLDPQEPLALMEYLLENQWVTVFLPSQSYEQYREELAQNSQQNEVARTEPVSEKRTTTVEEQAYAESSSLTTQLDSSLNVTIQEGPAIKESSTKTVFLF